MEFNECSTPALKKTFVVPNWYWPVVIPPATILRWCNRWPVMSLYCRSSSASLRMSAMAWLCFLHKKQKQKVNINNVVRKNIGRTICGPKIYNVDPKNTVGHPSVLYIGDGQNTTHPSINRNCNRKGRYRNRFGYPARRTRNASMTPAYFNCRKTFGASKESGNFSVLDLMQRTKRGLVCCIVLIKAVNWSWKNKKIGKMIISGENVVRKIVDQK